MSRRHRQDSPEERPRSHLSNTTITSSELSSCSQRRIATLLGGMVEGARFVGRV